MARLSSHNRQPYAKKIETITTQISTKRHENECKESNSKLLAACRLTLIVDPLLWLPMSKRQCSQALRWRLGWLPGGIPRPCIYHPYENFTRSHAIYCLHMHRRLQLSRIIEDPLSFLMNHLPTKKPSQPQNVAPWTVRWPAICNILHEMDYIFHGIIPPDPPPDIGATLVNWMLNQK